MRRIEFHDPVNFARYKNAKFSRKEEFAALKSTAEADVTPVTAAWGGAS
jgi:hypothetical protein